MTYYPVIRESGEIFTVEVQMDVSPKEIRALQDGIERGTDRVVVYMTITPAITAANLFSDCLESIEWFKLDVQTPSYSVYSQVVNLWSLQWGINDLNEYLVTSIPKMVKELDRIESGNFFSH